jgi:hypothetical protein
MSRVNNSKKMVYVIGAQRGAGCDTYTHPYNFDVTKYPGTTLDESLLQTELSTTLDTTRKLIWILVTSLKLCNEQLKSLIDCG